MNIDRYAAALTPTSCAIFLLHGVVARHRGGIRNYTRKHIDAEEFSRVCAALVRRGTSVTMDDVLTASMTGHALPPYAFALTFDDGFANCVHVAAPILRQYRIPATFYVTTDFVDRGASSWIDLIEHALSVVEHAELRLTPIGVSGTWRSDLEKLQLLDSIRARVKPDSTIDPYEVAEDVRKQLGVSELPNDRDLDAKMTWDEVRALAKDPLFTVGGHGHTHRILAHLPARRLEEEVSTSTRLLERALGHSPIHYSYPEGLDYCYSPEVVAVLRRHGIRCCPTAEHGVNAPGDDPFHLRRIFIV